MKKIAIVSGSFPPDYCGVGDYTYNLLKNINDKKYKIYLYTQTHNTSYENTYIINNWKFINFIKLIINIKKERIEWVNIQWPTQNYGRSIGINILPYCLRFLGIKVLLTIHEYSTVSLLGKKRTEMMFYPATKIITVDKLIYERIEKKLNNNKKIYFVPISSNISKSYMKNNEIQILKKRIWKTESNNIIFVNFGFITPNKCFEIIIEAFGELKAKGVLTSNLLCITEFDSKNDYHRKIADLVKKYDLIENIIFTGYLDNGEVGNYIRTADYGLLLFREGLSRRNGSFLAEYQENIPIVTTLSKDCENFSNIYCIENDCDILKKVIIGIQNNQIIFKQKSNIDEQILGWKEIAIIYSNILEEVY